MDALSYVFVCRHASASDKDVMRVASFLFREIEIQNLVYKIKDGIKCVVQGLYCFCYQL